MNEKTTVLIADDHALMRDGLTLLLSPLADIQVIGQACSGHEAVRMAADLKPQVIVMDIDMPDLNGIDATRRITAHSGDSRVVALSAHYSQQHIAQMLSAGATGFVPKQSAFDELATAIRTAASNRMYLSPTIAGMVVSGLSRDGRGNGASVGVTLTQREQKILQSIAEGHATKEIAFHLGVSVKTIETHRRNLMDKLNLHSVAQLTKYAIREGLTTMSATGAG